MKKDQAGRTPAIIAYCTIIGSLIAITMNIEPKNSFARFHTRQAFGVHLVYHSLAFFMNYSRIDSGWFLLYAVYLIAWGYGLLGAINGKEQMLPGLGPYFQKWFTFIP